MQNIDYSKVYKISFWKRSQNSIEQVNDYQFVLNDSLWSFKYNGSEIEIDDNKIKHLISSLKELEIDNVSEDFKAYYYEDDKKNYALKFLLFIEDNNHIYLGLKGLYPFKQDKYQEIINLFEQIKK